MRMTAVILGLTLVTCAAAQPTYVRLIDDFDDGQIPDWQSSMSGEYYKGGTGQKGLQVVDDPQRGKVLQAMIRYVDELGSEPTFITRTLDPRPSKLDIVGVRFWAKLTDVAIAPVGGFKVRLRTGDTSFTDYDVQDQLGKPFPAGEWVRVQLDTGIGPNVRNIWNQVFGTVRQMTFRLDDIDDKNSEFGLLVDDIELVIKQPAQDVAYTPTQHERPQDKAARILLMKHNAAGYYNIERAIDQAVPGAEVDAFNYRGYHFEFFGFPTRAEQVLAYDAIIMLDVDPFIMTYEQCSWVADAVASGSHLLVFGGPVTLTHAKQFKAPLRAVVPVTFEPGAKDIPVSAPPKPEGEHFLNRGLDPAGLGVVSTVHDVTPNEDAQIPWTAKDRPLIITAPVGKGRSTLVNTWARVDRSPTGDFFTSTLSDDLMRQLVRYALKWFDGTEIASLQLPTLSVVGDGQVTLRADHSGAGGPMTLHEHEWPLVPGPREPVMGRLSQRAQDGSHFFTIPVECTTASRTMRHFRIEAATPARGRTDYRDFEISVLNPLSLQVRWERSKYTFAPGSPVELTAELRRRDLPQVQPGETTTVTYADGSLPVRVDNFSDTWVYKPGSDTIIHSLVGSADVKTESHEGLVPSWTVTGQPRAARPAEGVSFGPDDRILNAVRQVKVGQAGRVEVLSEYEFRHDMKVSRLPVTMSLPVSIYAGMKYTVEQAGGTTQGVLPVDTKRGKLFDGYGLKMTIETPAGPITISVTDPDRRVWMRDLRQYDMASYRLEIEAPYEDCEAKAKEKYRTDVVITGPVPGAGSAPQVAPSELQVAATMVDPRTGHEWGVPRVPGDGAPRFKSLLPNLSSGEYVMQVTAQARGEVLVQTSVPCHVVDPLDLSDLFPIMSIVGIGDNGHYLDDAGVKARVDDLVAHGFNTAAITGTSNFSSASQSNSRRLKGVAESYAQRLAMATTYEYSNFTDLRRDRAPAICVFDPAYHDSLKERLAWQIDVGNRTPRLITAKVLDEPTVGPTVLSNIGKAGKAEFKKLYGIDYSAELYKSNDPYTRWCWADFAGRYVAEGYRHSAGILEELNASFDLLLTYMATGLGYQRPLTGQQDALDWTRQVKWADFDVYPYFYPASQRVRMVQAEFAMSSMRDISRALDVPWGFYMELDDRNWPFQKNPRQATAECGFTAVANGAGYLNSFINTVAGTGTQSRPERWEAAGKALRSIRRIGPMLKHMPPTRASVAILFPSSEQAISNGYPTPQYALQAIQGGYGECDVHSEEIILEKGRIPYDGLVLLGAEYVHEDLVPLLKSWLTAGGVLICDKLPAKTHRNAAIEWDMGGDLEPGKRLEPIRWSVEAVGQGKLVLIDNNLNDEFGELVEAEALDAAACGAYRSALAGLLDGLGLVPKVRVSYSETAQSVDLVAAGLRGEEDGMLITVVNHQPDAQDVRVVVAGKDLSWFVDVDTMTPVPFARAGQFGATLSLRIPGRWARMIAAYRVKPVSIAARLRTARLEAGSDLRYRVAALDESGRPVKGGILLQVQVTDPEGNIVTRYGGSFAPVDGVRQVRVPVALNAPKGTYTLTAHAPQIDARDAVQFEVR